MPFKLRTLPTALAPNGVADDYREFDQEWMRAAASLRESVQALSASMAQCTAAPRPRHLSFS